MAASFKEEAHDKHGREAEKLQEGSQKESSSGGILKEEHHHVYHLDQKHGAGVVRKKDDHIVDCRRYDDGSGDVAECHGVSQQAEHFKCTHQG
ncbi:conserved hypothetical protein [Ricinus communis]|uniref:Uncharacterized protein n=1 Tax=Ricinus communis TaxID=3988 RepID=B9S9W2_RICCO|nr:conserved hypothetical protein [Ricinus communis]